jgi:hypothetical protein
VYCIQQINGHEPRVQHTANQWTWATCTAYSKSMDMSHVYSIQQINGHEPRVLHTANQWTWATCTAYSSSSDRVLRQGSHMYCVEQISRQHTERGVKVVWKWIVFSWFYWAAVLASRLHSVNSRWVSMFMERWWNWLLSSDSSTCYSVPKVLHGVHWDRT